MPDATRSAAKTSDPRLMELCRIFEAMETEHDYEVRESLCRKGVSLLEKLDKELRAAAPAPPRPAAAAALERLAAELRFYSLSELRWDYLCNITPETRQVIANELERRGVSLEQFEQFGRGTPRGAR